MTYICKDMRAPCCALLVFLIGLSFLVSLESSAFILMSRYECLLMLLLVVLFVARTVALLPSLEDAVRDWIFVALYGATACLVASIGSVSLYLATTRVCQRVLYGGWWFALSDAFSDLPAQLAWALGIFLVFTLGLSLAAVGRVGVFSIILFLGLYATGNLPSKYGTELSGGATLEDRLDVTEFRLKLISGFVPILSVAEKEQLLAEERLHARALLAELGTLGIPNAVEAYYWCLQERIPCAGARALLKAKGGDFPSENLSLYNCSR